MSGVSRDRLVERTAIAASVLMLVWMSRALLLGEVPLTGDLLHTHYPLRDFYARALSRGWRFDWMPALYGGFDLIGEGQVGGYHPLHWLWYRLLPLDVAFDIEMVAAYPLMFAGTWLFLRRWCDTGSAAFGAMLFTFSGFSLAHGVHPNMVSVLAHLPWILWCIDRAFAASSWPAQAGLCAAIGALTGSELLLGHPQAVWLSGLAEAAYAVFLLLAGPAAQAPGLRHNRLPGGVHPDRPQRGRGVVTLVAGKLLGLGVGAIQVIATYDASLHSTRAGFDAEFPFTYAMPASHLLQLLFPYAFWGRVLRWTEAPNAGDEVAVYAGAVPIVLAVWWAARAASRRRRGEALTAPDRFALGALLFAILGLWLALGRAGGIYYLQTLLPVVGSFRAPLRFVLFTHFALGCVSAVAIMQLARLTREHARSVSRASRAAWIPAALATGLAVVVLTMPGMADVVSGRTMAAVLMSPPLFAAAAMFLTLAIRRSRPALAGLVLLAAGDQALYGLGGVVAWQDFATRAGVISLLGPSGSLPPTEPNRIVCCPYPNINVLAGYRTIDAYLGLTPARQLNYRTQPALRLAQVGYAYHIAVETSAIPDAQRVSADWYQLPAPVARARLVSDAQVSRNVSRDLDTIDVDRTALVTHDLQLPAGPPGTAVITRDEPGSIVVRTRATTRQLLVISEMFHEGWTATVDGRPGQVERVNADFLGSVVPAGEHDVSLAFRPSYHSTGGAISVAFACLCAALGAISWFFHRFWRRSPV